MKKLLCICGLILLLATVSVAYAQESSITFQVADLGGCESKEACKAYCEIETNKESCLSFAESRGLMKKEEVEKAKKFVAQPGPGGCRGEACKKYCADPNNREECTEFGLKHGFITKEEAERMKKFKAIENEAGPGGCKGEACREYCSDPVHQKECFEFAKSKGFIKPEDEEQFEKGNSIKEEIAKNGGPGGCKSETECRTFCNSPDNTETCIAFGAEHGAVKSEEATKMLQNFREHKARFEEMKEKGLVESGQRGQFGEAREMQGDVKGPGGCTSKEECEKFCADNPEECQKFQPAQRGMVESGRQPGNFKGPAGCASPEECEKLCAENPEKCGGGEQGRMPNPKDNRQVRPQEFQGKQERVVDNNDNNGGDRSDPQRGVVGEQRDIKGNPQGPRPPQGGDNFRPENMQKNIPQGQFQGQFDPKKQDGSNERFPNSTPRPQGQQGFENRPTNPPGGQFQPMNGSRPQPRDGGMMLPPQGGAPQGGSPQGMQGGQPPSGGNPPPPPSGAGAPVSTLGNPEFNTANTFQAFKAYIGKEN